MVNIYATTSLNFPANALLVYILWSAKEYLCRSAALTRVLGIAQIAPYCSDRLMFPVTMKNLNGNRFKQYATVQTLKGIGATNAILEPK